MFLMIFFLLATNTYAMESQTTANPLYTLYKKNCHYYNLNNLDNLDNNDESSKLILQGLQSITGAWVNYDNSVFAIATNIMDPKATIETIQNNMPKKTIIDINSYLPNTATALAFWTTIQTVATKAHYYPFILYTNEQDICLKVGNLIQDKKEGFALRDSTYSAQWLKNHTGAIKPRGDLYVYYPQEPDKCIIFSLLYKATNKRHPTLYNTFVLGAYKDKKEFNAVTDIDKERIISILKNQQATYCHDFQNTIFKIIYTNQKTETGATLSNCNIKDEDYEIAIDDGYIENTNTEPTLNLLIRLIFEKTYLNDNIKLTVYCLYSGKIIRNSSFSIPNPVIKLLQINIANSFLNDPVYFDNKTTNSILPLHFTENNGEEKTHTVHYKVVESYTDYFKQTDAEKNTREKKIINTQFPAAAAINNPIYTIDSTHNEPELPKELLEAFTSLTRYLTNRQESDSVKKELKTVLDQTKKMLTQLYESYSTLNMIDNEFTLHQHRRSDTLNNEINSLKKNTTNILTTFRKDLEETKNNIKLCKSKQNEVQTQLEQMTTQANTAFETKASGFFATLTKNFLFTLEKHITNYTSECNTLKSDRETLKNEYNTAIKTITEKATATQRKMTECIRNMELIIKNNKVLLEELNTKEEDFNTMEQRITENNQKILRELNKKKEAFNDMEQKLENNKKECSNALRLFKTEYDKKIEAQQTTITTLENKLNTTENKLANAKNDISSLKKFNWRLNFCTLCCTIYFLIKLKNVVLNPASRDSLVASILSI